MSNYSNKLRKIQMYLRNCAIIHVDSKIKFVQFVNPFLDQFRDSVFVIRHSLYCKYILEVNARGCPMCGMLTDLLISYYEVHAITLKGRDTSHSAIYICIYKRQPLHLSATMSGEEYSRCGGLGRKLTNTLAAFIQCLLQRLVPTDWSWYLDPTVYP